MILTAEEYIDGIKHMAFTNYDGWAFPAKFESDLLVVDKSLYLIPSNYGEDIPDGYTHVQWING